MISRTLLLAALAAPLTAQLNPFLVFPQDPERQTITAASYVRRPDWNAQGEGFQQVSQDLFRGVGDNATGTFAYGFYHWAADLNSATPETYGVILRHADPLGAPDVTAAGIIVQVQNLSLPTTPQPANTGWIMTDVFATPAALPPAGNWFQGLELPANPSWPASDGHSIWSADTLAANTPATVGENGRFSAPPVTWTARPSGVTFRTQWTYIMGALVTNPTLHVGGIDPLSARTGVLGAPSYGMNGLFPDISGTPRSDGLNLRMQDNQQPNGIAVYAAGPAFWPGALPVPGFVGNLHLDVTTLFVLGFALPANGAAVLPVATPGALPPSLVGTFFLWQGLWFDPATGSGRFSNAQATSF